MPWGGAEDVALSALKIPKGAAGAHPNDLSRCLTVLEHECGTRSAARSQLFPLAGLASGPVSAAPQRPFQRRGREGDRARRFRALDPSIRVRAWRLITERHGRL